MASRIRALAGCWDVQKGPSPQIWWTLKLFSGHPSISGGQAALCLHFSAASLSLHTIPQAFLPCVTWVP